MRQVARSFRSSSDLGLRCVTSSPHSAVGLIVFRGAGYALNVVFIGTAATRVVLMRRARPPIV